MDIKTRPLELKDIDPIKGIYTGYASTYTMDDGDPPDIVEPGAFKKTIQENGPESSSPRIKVLYQHDFFSPIGKPLVLKEDSTGLYHESQIAPTSLGKDVLTLMQEGVITEQSIGFDTIKSDMDQNGVRHLRELKLWEFSPVTWGMNANTPILGVKGTNAVDALAERIKRAEKAIKRGELKNEDLIMALEQALPLWRTELKRTDNPPTHQEPETIVVHTKGSGNVDKYEVKSPDFNQLMTAQQLSDAFYQMRYALREAIEGALFDPAVTDKVSAVSTICDQFKTATIALVQQMIASGMLNGQTDEVEEAMTAFGSQGPDESKSAKAGRVLSSDNLDKLKQAHAHLADVINSAGSSGSGDNSEPSGGKGAHSDNEPDPEVVHSIKDFLAQMQQETKKRGVS